MNVPFEVICEQANLNRQLLFLSLEFKYLIFSL